MYSHEEFLYKYHASVYVWPGEGLFFFFYILISIKHKENEKIQPFSLFSLVAENLL